jgi:carboxymethylenebutenolidase
MKPPIALASAAIILGLAAAARGQSPPAAIPAATIPADAEHAAKALQDSPRHGEWVDVPMPGAEPAGAAIIRTWISYPERADKAGVVVVIHEIFGLTDWVRAVADQLAAEGFIAVAPDLLSGKGPGGGGTESFAGDGARGAIGKLARDEVNQRLDAVRRHALALPAARGRGAVIGFCWGGSSSFAYAAAQPEIGGAVVYYGTAPSDREVLARVACPVLGLYGGDDARVTATVESTASAMSELKKAFSPHVYAGAGHGFLRQQSGREGADLKAAQEAWRETVAFLRSVLAP